MLNRSGERGHSCLVPDLSGKALSFCPLSVMLAVVLSYMAFIMLRNAPSIPTLLSVWYHKWVLYIIKCFSPCYWYNLLIFVFCFVYGMYYIYWFPNIVPILHPWDESRFNMVYDLFNILLDVVCQYFVEDFSICSSVILAWRFLSSLCLYLVLGLGWCWLHKKSLGVFHLLEFFAIICGEWGLSFPLNSL